MGWPGLKEGIASEDRVPFERMSVLVVDDGGGYVRCRYLLPLNHLKMATTAVSGAYYTTLTAMKREREKKVDGWVEAER